MKTETCVANTCVGGR